MFSSSLRARRSDSGEECAIYHTTNRDTTFCGDQIVSPNTPDRHISLAKLAGAGAVISHRITNYQPGTEETSIGPARFSLDQSYGMNWNALDLEKQIIFAFKIFLFAKYLQNNTDCGLQEAFSCF